MDSIIERGALPLFIWGIALIVLSVTIAFIPVIVKYKKPKKFDEEKWAKTIGEFLSVNTYLDGGNYKTCTAPHEISEVKIFYQVEGKEYIKYVNYCFDDPLYIYYRISKPNIFVFEDEYRERVHLSITRNKKRKEKIDFSHLFLSILVAFFIFVFGMNLLTQSFDENITYDGHGGSTYNQKNQ